jgi:hypothetical protein
MFVLIASGGSSLSSRWRHDAHQVLPSHCRWSGSRPTRFPTERRRLLRKHVKPQNSKFRFRQLLRASDFNNFISWQDTECGDISPASGFMIVVQHFGAPIMTDFLNFHAFATKRGEGLHPELRLLFERAARSSVSDVAIRRDGFLQSGPNPTSEAAPERVNVSLVRQT